MKRREACRIRNSQRIQAHANNTGLAATHALEPSTLTDDYRQIWGQEIWPDCLD
ncbi:hypothetical protein J2W15_003151 [Pseudarthrobacter sulfonivorans]|nr:hypothetical protein [Pseudarthrobacter sulfonivorans]